MCVRPASENLTDQNCNQIEQESVNSSPNEEVLTNYEPKISKISLPLYRLIPILVFQHYCLDSETLQALIRYFGRFFYTLDSTFLQRLTTI